MWFIFNSVVSLCSKHKKQHKKKLTTKHSWCDHCLIPSLFEQQLSFAFVDLFFELFSFHLVSGMTQPLLVMLKDHKQTTQKHGRVCVTHISWPAHAHTPGWQRMLIKGLITSQVRACYRGWQTSVAPLSCSCRRKKVGQDLWHDKVVCLAARCNNAKWSKHTHPHKHTHAHTLVQTAT